MDKIGLKVSNGPAFLLFFSHSAEKINLDESETTGLTDQFGKKMTKREQHTNSGDSRNAPASEIH